MENTHVSTSLADTDETIKAAIVKTSAEQDFGVEG